MWWLIVFVLILIAAFSPIIPIAVVDLLLGGDTDMNESNSTIAALPWLLFFTVPIGAVLELLWIVRGVVYLAWGV